MYPKVIRTEIASENNTEKISDIKSEPKESNFKIQEEQKNKMKKFLQIQVILNQ